MCFTDYSRCQCGAITIYTESGKSYSFKESNRRKIFHKNLDLRKLHKLPDSYCCNHCVNHWGLDLCACGSGESPQKCDGKTDVCGLPMQILYGRTCVIDKNSPLARCLY